MRRTSGRALRVAGLSDDYRTALEAGAGTGASGRVIARTVEGGAIVWDAWDMRPVYRGDGDPIPLVVGGEKYEALVAADSLPAFRPFSIVLDPRRRSVIVGDTGGGE